MTDILFNTDTFIFSYRTGGILMRNSKILLPKPQNDDGYSIPGGHVTFNETYEDALILEFKEEISEDIKIDQLMMVGENFSPWGSKPCHQISLYYLIS